MFLQKLPLKNFINKYENNSPFHKKTHNYQNNLN